MEIKADFQNSFSQSFILSINFIHEVKIFNEIQNNKKILIFDLRKTEQYNESNLDFCVNIPYDKYEDDFFENFDEKKFSDKTQDSTLKDMILRYKRYYIVIVMSQEKIPRKKIINKSELNKEEEDITRKSLLLYQALIKKRVRELGLYNIGFKKFTEHYDFLVRKGNIPPLTKNISNFPSEVFDHKIYIGNQHHALNDEIVNILKITHIINATLHVENKFENKGVKYLNVNIDDTSNYRISKYFKETYDFIESALKSQDASENDNISKEIKKDIEFLQMEQNETVLSSTDIQQIEKKDPKNLNNIFDLVESWTFKNKILQILFKKHYEKYNNQNRILIHCSLGISRSPTLATMYVMKKFKLNFDKAFDFIKFQRFASNPIFSFTYELEDFGKGGFKFEGDSEQNYKKKDSRDSLIESIAIDSQQEIIISNK